MDACGSGIRKLPDAHCCFALCLHLTPQRWLALNNCFLNMHFLFVLGKNHNASELTPPASKQLSFPSGKSQPNVSSGVAHTRDVKV